VRLSWLENTIQALIIRRAIVTRKVRQPVSLT